MTDKKQATGAGVPAAQLDAILLAMHLRQRAKLTATGNADALSQNAANVLVAQYDRIAELEALQAAPPAPGAVAVPAASEVLDALNYVDDFIARCNGDDRGSCASVNLLRAALAAAPAQAWPSECDSPELCQVHRGCAGQYGTKNTCPSFAALNPCNSAAPAQEHATQLAGQGQDTPPGFALVPLRLTRAMEKVLQEEDWQWADLLAEAGALNADDFDALSRDDLTDTEVFAVAGPLFAHQQIGGRVPSQDLDGFRELIGSALSDAVFQRAAPAQAQEDARDADGDKALLDFLRDTCCDLRSIEVPTGGDDSDVHWRVIEHCMGELREREIGRSWSDDPRDAIRAAIAAQAKGGA